MTRDEIEALARKRLTSAGWFTFAAAVQRGRLEPTAGVSGAVCRLWIDWLQAEPTEHEVHLDPAAMIAAHYAELGRRAIVLEVSDLEAARDVDNETDKETDDWRKQGLFCRPSR